MQSGTPPVTPDCRAYSISCALSGYTPLFSCGWIFSLNSAVWKRRNASMDSSATQYAALPARDE